MTSAAPLAFERISAVGERAAQSRAVADEMPVAIECNGIGYAVLMASPSELEDLACGFALTERLIDDVEDIIDVDVHPVARGIILRMNLADRVVERIANRTRHRTTDASCGLCGIENLEQVFRPLPSLSERSLGTDDAVFRAYAALERLQPLNALTGAVHAAAACSPGGDIRIVREDVGRHNAFDKLIGAMLRGGTGWHGGFALLTSRCSFELVEKAVLAGCPMLATISAPTGLAVERANETGLQLRTLVRSDSMLRVVRGAPQASL